MDDRLKREFIAEVENTVAQAFKDESSGTIPFIGGEYVAQDLQVRNAHAEDN